MYRTILKISCLILIAILLYIGCGKKSEEPKTNNKIPAGPPASGWAKPLISSEIEGTYHYGILNLLTIQPRKEGIKLQFYGTPSSYSRIGKIHNDRLVFTVDNGNPSIQAALTFDSSRNQIYLQRAGKDNTLVGTRIKSDREQQLWPALMNKQYDMASTLLEQELLNQPKNSFLLWAQAYLIEQSGNYEEASNIYQELFNSNPDPVILPALYRGLDAMKGRIASTNDKNAIDYFSQATVYLEQMLNQLPTISSIMLGTENLDSSNQLIVSEYLLQYESLFEQFRIGNQKTVCLAYGDYLMNEPSYFPYQMAVQHWILKGKLEEFRKNYEQALEIYLQVFKMGELFNQGSLSQRKFSLSIRSEGVDAISSLLQKLLPVSIIKKLQESMYQFIQSEKDIQLDQIWKYQLINPSMDISRSEFDNQIKIIRTRERMLTIAAAAKLYSLEKNKFPKTASDIIPRYLSGMPPDYFTGTGLKIIGTDSTFTVYSVGPDTNDDLGKILYDPKKGTSGKGDIVLSLSK